MRRRATSGEMARGGLVFVFSLEVAPVSGGVGAERGVVAVCSEGGCGGEGLTTGVVRHACRHRVTARGVFGLGGGALLPFVLRRLREHVLAGGPASHACRRGSGCTRGFNFLFWGILSHAQEWMAREG